MRTTPNEYELSGLSKPTGMEQVMPGVCPSQPLLAPVTSGGLTHPLQWVLRPRLGTQPPTYWHHTGLEQEFFYIQWQVFFSEFTATSNWLLSVLRLHPLEEEGFITVVIEEGDKQLKTRRRSSISVNITICWSFLTQNNWECFLCLTNQLKRIVYKISEILENKL